VGFLDFFNSEKKKTDKKKEGDNKKNIINIFNPKAASHDYYKEPKSIKTQPLTT